MSEIGFLLKKFISYFIHPFGMVFTLFAIGLYLLLSKKERLAKFYLVVTFLLLSLFSYQPFANFLISGLESQYSKFDPTQKVGYIHVLGGGNGQRVMEGIILHNKIKGSKLIFTGYAGDNNISSAKKNEDIALALGVKKEDIILDESAKDTFEEAMFTKKLLQNEPFALVTSAAHMPRAMRLFESFGLHPIAAPADFHMDETVSYFQAPGLGELNNSTASLHEYLGILWGKIKSLF